MYVCMRERERGERDTEREGGERQRDREKQLHYPTTRPDSFLAPVHFP